MSPEAAEAVWLSPPVQPCAGGDRSEEVLAAANLGAAPVTLRLPSEPSRRAILLSSTDPDRLTGEVDPDRLILLPSEVVVLMTLVDRRAPVAPAAMVRLST